MGSKYEFKPTEGPGPGEYDIPEPPQKGVYIQPEEERYTLFEKFLPKKSKSRVGFSSSFQGNFSGETRNISPAKSGGSGKYKNKYINSSVKSKVTAASSFVTNTKMVERKSTVKQSFPVISEAQDDEVKFSVHYERK